MVYTRGMATPQPIYSDRFRRSAWHMMTPVVAAVLIVAGLLQTEFFNILLGAGLALFILLTRHARYDLFDDRLVIRYVGPRTKIMPLAEIEGVQRIRMTLGGQGVFLQKKGGLGLVINPMDADRFAAELEDVRRKLAE